jgi:hypothetical protein
MGKMSDLLNEERNENSALDAFLPPREESQEPVTATGSNDNQQNPGPGPVVFDIPDIRTSALLVDLTITEWSGKKKDVDASEAVTRQNQAVDNAAKVIKDLLPKSKELKELHKYVAQVRKAHIQKTMAWSGRGKRLIPTALLPDYKKWEGETKAEFRKLVDKFISTYEFELKKVHIELGSLYDPADYDTKEEVAACFTIIFDYDPVPESGDFRVDVGKEALAELQASCDNAYTRAVQTATADLWKRLHRPLSNMIAQLKEDNFDGTVKGFKKNGDPKEAGFKETLVPNVLDILKMMKVCNWSDDPVMDNAIRSLEANLKGVSSGMLKGNTATRQKVRNTAEQVLKSIPTLDI